MNKLTVLVTFGTIAIGWSTAAAQLDDHAKWDISKLDPGKLPAASGKKGITYQKDIRPLLEASCFNCHGEERQRGELRLDSLEALLKGGETGKIVTPGSSAKSLLVYAAAQVNDDIAMPPKRPAGGPPGPPGGPGGPGSFQPPPDVLKRFDKDGDGQLNESERRAMAAEFRPGGGQQGGGPGNRPGGPGRPGGPPKPLTAEQVGLLRAWIDQGAK